MLPFSIVKPIREQPKIDLCPRPKLFVKYLDFSDSIENEDATCTEHGMTSSLVSIGGKQIDPDELNIKQSFIPGLDAEIGYSISHP